MSSSDYVFGRGRSHGAAAADFIGGLTAGMTPRERLNQVQFLARAMDEQFLVPGTNIRFGWDTILGLFPGIGDALTSAISLLIVHHARQTGASSILLARMIANVGVDFLLGSIPLVGEAFDFAWKANRKNARLLEQHLRAASGLRDLRLG
jgi:hypothetical protein